MMKRFLLIYPMATLFIIAMNSCGGQASSEKARMGKGTLKGNTSAIGNADAYAANYSPGGKWKLVWADEFNNLSLDTNNWNRQIVKAGRFNNEWQRYTDSEENAYIEDGSLVINAIHASETHDLDQYTSARINSARKQAWTYGRIAARIKLPYGQGIWPAFWTLGNNINENGGDTPWPHCGEIDILELYGSVDPGVVKANIHFSDSTGSYKKMGAVPYKLKEGKFADNFHIFELDWNADSIKWLVDGVKYASTPITDAGMEEFHQPQFILFNIAVGGNAAGRPDDTTPFPQKMIIDWVRVYQQQD